MKGIVNNWEEMFNKHGLPQQAIEEFKTYCSASLGAEVKIVPDPRVPGTFAIHVTRPRSEDEVDTFGLLWMENSTQFFECEFETWPPESGDLQFFI
jgi:hypothetical protein